VYEVDWAFYQTLGVMSRVPIRFQPSPTDVAAISFGVMSEEWSADRSMPAQLARVVVNEDSSTCTFIPGELWLQEGLFPASEQSFSLAELESLCTNRDLYGPPSIYTHRALQAMRTVLMSRVRRDA
jgi:hypothetical protein